MYAVCVVGTIIVAETHDDSQLTIKCLRNFSMPPIAYLPHIMNI